MRNLVLSLELHEGKNRQIRKMCEACDLEIQRLQRVAIGGGRDGGFTCGCMETSHAAAIEMLGYPLPVTRGARHTPALMSMYLDPVRRSHLFAFCFFEKPVFLYFGRSDNLKKEKQCLTAHIRDIEKRMYRASKQHARKEEKDSFYMLIIKPVEEKKQQAALCCGMRRAISRRDNGICGSCG